jgi:predicted PurR-regulated permease PerM
MITSIIIGVVAYTVFYFLNINLSGLLGGIIGVSNMVPVIGPWLGLIIVSVIAVFQEPLFALYAALVALVLQLIEQFFLIPLIIGKALDLKPLMVVIAIIAGSFLLGFWGVIFAVPIAASVKIGYDIFIKKKSKE